MKQMTLAAAKGFEKHNRATRKAEFLARMERLMPWAEFCALIEPYYPKVGNRRPPVGAERMLRMYCVANWFNLSDEAREDALCDMSVFREFRFGLTDPAALSKLNAQLIVLCARPTNHRFNRFIRGPPLELKLNLDYFNHFNNCRVICWLLSNSMCFMRK